MNIHKFKYCKYCKTDLSSNSVLKNLFSLHIIFPLIFKSFHDQLSRNFLSNMVSILAYRLLWRVSRIPGITFILFDCSIVTVFGFIFMLFESNFILKYFESNFSFVLFALMLLGTSSKDRCSLLNSKYMYSKFLKISCSITLCFFISSIADCSSHGW